MSRLVTDSLRLLTHSSTSTRSLCRLSLWNHRAAVCPRSGFYGLAGFTKECARYQHSDGPEIRYEESERPIFRYWDTDSSPVEFQPFALNSSVVRFISDRTNVENEDSGGPTLRYDHKASWVHQEQEVKRLHQLHSAHSTDELERKLEEEAANRPKVHYVTSLLLYLYHNRKLQPTAQHYKCLILAQAEAKHGSRDGLSIIMREMEKDGFELESEHIHAALRVLAIHPDYILRSKVEDIARTKEVILSNEGWHDIVAGLIRERQLELAMHTVEKMEAQDIEVQWWLRQLLLYSFCDVEDFQAAIDFANQTQMGGQEALMNAWGYILDTASTANHYDTVRYLWNIMVDADAFNPATGTCFNILTTAARAGDPGLVTSVIKVLTEREETITLAEYEALIDAHVKSFDPESAFRVLCALPQVNLEPEDGTTRSIVSFLRSSQEYPPSAAWKFLRSLLAEADPGHVPLLPTAAINAVMEAHLDLGEHRAVQDIYDTMTTDYSFKANLRSFHILLRACLALGSIQLVERILRMMLASEVKPDALTYELAMQTADEAKDSTAIEQYTTELKEIKGGMV